jgi:hypothetical protein
MSSENDAVFRFVKLSEKITTPKSETVLRLVKLTEKITTPKSETVLRFVKLTENAQTPTKELPKAAGFNLRSAYDAIVPAREKE